MVACLGLGLTKPLALSTRLAYGENHAQSKNSCQISISFPRLRKKKNALLQEFHQKTILGEPIQIIPRVTIFLVTNHLGNYTLTPNFFTQFLHLGER